jgi:hypothetical protein
MYGEHNNSLIEEDEEGVDSHDAVAKSRMPCRSRRAWRGGYDELRMVHTVELSTNTPTGVPAGRGRIRAAAIDTTAGRAAACSGEQRWQLQWAGGMAPHQEQALPQPGTGSPRSIDITKTRVGRRFNPPEKDPSSRTPCHSDPSTACPLSSPLERPATLRRSATKPVDRTRRADRPRGRMRTSTPPPAAPCQPASPAVDHHASGRSWTRWHPLTCTGLNSHGFPARTGQRIMASTRRCLNL